MKSMTKKNTDHRTLTLERYLHCRLSMLSSRVSMRIAQTYGDKFAISVTEWRIMAVLGNTRASQPRKFPTKPQSRN